MAKPFLKNVERRFRYYDKGLLRSRAIPQFVLDVAEKLKIRIVPYYLVLERPGEVPSKPDPGYEFSALGPDDAHVIASLSRQEGRTELLKGHMIKGRRCFGIRYRGELVAVCWIDLDICGFWGHKIFRLEADEGYFFGMYTAEPHRGKGLAPYLRYRCHEVFSDLGRTKLYSISERFNTPSLRFKEKLGGRIEGSGYFVELFGRWRFGARPRPPGKRRHQG